ncbi:TPA: c-type cytochrome biogenesis protein CcmI [Aeromonas salmonicida subsp. salmonicida]|uniref:c-type cytochrome biogenesis protein CcmI n=1 Tax=Aeromonas salmonicida TaxID=645 RepID=UPI0013203DDD|nr:c-type cytochrome biogenesis protein CcmI [Aeromonas salmonicida]ELI6419245.1 c-type cytochrome biogenesis protein CcmI [Aeromonas salmonicida subsp. salmonicida]ELM3647684.1 c-type cytochrome biogenesis protein CcmI [Aeromonas salmonicida subsp. salmonicida]QHE45423.1 c-type cytochrome biogenesis protein CcmI [Aeromonas salmonicida subsp. salmonicida]QHE47230.1 c-type cytochrome biogenesis protein CcmI [Aeromonas salmonicida subsp. salmonicida]QJF54980.1 c-type cytochrome biogenesis protei
MTAFLIVITALLVLVSLTLAMPLWRGEGKQSISRSALNKQLYRQRLLEIGEEREQGILAEEPESLVELQRSLLDDIPDVEQSARGGKSLIWIPGVLVLVGVSLGLYYKLGAWQEVQRWQDASSRLGELSNRILVERDAQVTEQDLLDFMLALRTRLKDEPNDYRGWLLLGRLSLDGNDPDMAREALERAYDLAPQKTMVAVPYAQALMMTGDDAQADELLRSAIALDPANIEARSVYAFMALQKEDFKTALMRWREMLPLMEKGSTRYAMVERSIDYAEQQLKQRGIAVTIPGAANKSDEQGQQLEVKKGEFPIHVTLAAGIQMPEDAHLFVFAVVPNGPPMPIAVKRIAGPTLPVTLSLGDDDAMMEGSKLSAYPQLQFKARLSRGGNVMNKEGAFEGVSTSIPTDAIPSAPIDIRIDHAL